MTVNGKAAYVYYISPTQVNVLTPPDAMRGSVSVQVIEDALTQPGQWFLDRSTTPWALTYLANPGEDPNADTVVIPQLAQLLVTSNLKYVTFHGMAFEHDDYTVPFTGHASSELEADIPAAVSFQNSQHITFDSGTVTNLGDRPGDDSVSQRSLANDASVPQFTTVQNNVVEGYGRTIPAAFGIGQGMGHDNLYTHNDVYDGYHCAISTSQSIGDTTRPAGIGNANNVISFNHVYNLLQGIMNDGGSIRIAGGNEVFTAAGNKILNNKIHDVTDASIMDSNGYGGPRRLPGRQHGLVDVENNLIYRDSGFEQSLGEDLQSVVQNPGFNNPAYPGDDYSLPHGSPGVGFVVFDAGQAGRSNPVLKPRSSLRPSRSDCSIPRRITKRTSAS